MPKKKPLKIDDYRKEFLIKAAGLKKTNPENVQTINDEIEILPLNERIRILLDIVKKPKSKTRMIYVIMYDIENDKVRNLIAKYLIKAGCIRIQKSVYLIETEYNRYKEIRDTLAEVQAIYENMDSIIIFPISTDEIKAMNIIGRNIDLSLITDNPNTLFF